MKTLKSIILGLALLIVCGVAKAGNNTEANFSKTHAIDTYVDAMTRGKLSGLNDVLDQSVKFSMLKGKNVISFTKKEMVDFLQSNKDVEQTCTTNTSIVESNDDISVVKVDMQFDGFVRTNYVTLTNTGNGWKITNVYSVFK